ncbi:MAG: polysaccharide deacetylase family protein [Acidimicrobiia bacterium]|nr:polysaccharide deacetylase family protein [Acidimicrobiia bacterium]
MMVKRHLLKTAVLTGSVVPRWRSRDVIILMYHTVSGQLDLEMDVPFERFLRQMSHLAETGRVRSLNDALARLRTGDTSGGPFYVITFDDAYRDFHTHAAPVLTDLGLPATLYVPTGFVDNSGSHPVTKPLASHEYPGACTWDMLREHNDSQLITLGSHTHDHPELTSLIPVEVKVEVEMAIARFEDELGFRPAHFAYPRGKWNPQVEELIRPYHETLAVIEGQANSADDFNPYRLTRVGIGKSDTMPWFRHKLRGRLDGEETVKALARRGVARMSVEAKPRHPAAR